MCAERQNNIVVVGSMNMDLVLHTNVLPKQGETVFGQRFTTSPGGKGANQAVAASRLNGNVHMIGAVGADAFGRELREQLIHNRVQTDALLEVDVETGIALIQLHDGDNRITVVSGANYAIDVAHILRYKEMIERAALVVLQLELRAELTEWVLHQCNAANVPVLFNPAPATHFQHEWLPYITYMTPNETECVAIFGQTPEEAAIAYPKKVIVTCGGDGALFADDNGLHRVMAPVVDVVDTTGAGDTFNGALAVALVERQPLAEAIQFAVQAASKAVQKLGAQAGMPKRVEL